MENLVVLVVMMGLCICLRGGVFELPFLSCSDRGIHVKIKTHKDTFYSIPKELSTEKIFIDYIILFWSGYGKYISGVCAHIYLIFLNKMKVYWQPNLNSIIFIQCYYETRQSSLSI